ncbi:hypothetical protein ABW19_dt0200745 [Dactylella cylindrospora]|nr:hypothetical protein ABW19_dt0200745 [Dactylella cylindrospora]
MPRFPPALTFSSSVSQVASQSKSHPHPYQPQSIKQFSTSHPKASLLLYTYNITMDFLKGLTENKGEEKKPEEKPVEKKEGLGGLLDQAGSFINNQAGGGEKGEKREDYLDKGIDLVQEKVLGAGPQNNESAAEQAKDEAISDFIRDQYKKQTGKDFPVADKE